MKKTFFLLLLIPTIVVAKAPFSFEIAFESDRYWPSRVVPTKTVTVEQAGKIIELKSGLPLVLIRAYEDGNLAVVDRVGTFIIDYSATDFLHRVKDSMSAVGKEGQSTASSGVFINQIGRRIFKLGSEKAASEKALFAYESFLIKKVPANKSALKEFVKIMEPSEKECERQKCCIIVVLDKPIPNQEFHALLEETEFPYFTVVPIFTQSFLQAQFTPFEAGLTSLHLRNTGKLMSASTLTN